MFPRTVSLSELQGNKGISLGGAKVTPNTVSAGQLQKVASLSDINNPKATLGGGAAAPQGLVSTSVGGGTVDAAAQAAAAAAAANAAKVAQLRGEVTNIANSIKNIFNSRYGQVDQAAAEQTGKLNSRFATESGDIQNQVAAENDKLGAAHAASGSYDSSYRGNNVDTVTHGGEAQIRDLGTELQDNLGSVGGWAQSQKAGFDAQKGGIDAVLSHLGESTDPAELTSIRNTLDSRIAELQAGNADNNTGAQNRSALETIAPSSQRAQQLKTTLSQIVAGNADGNMKSAIANKLIQSANLTPQDQQALTTAFQGDLLKQQQQTA